MVPPSYVCWFINPMKSIVISAINHSEMGVMFTNLANELGHHLVTVAGGLARRFGIPGFHSTGHHEYPGTSKPHQQQLVMGWMPSKTGKSSPISKSMTGWWLTNPSEKYEFVNGKDDIPYIMENKLHVPNHQPDEDPPSYICWCINPII